MMHDGREYTKLVTEDGLNAVLVDPDTGEPVAWRWSTKQRGTELPLELEAKRRPLPFQDAADTGPADTGRLLELVDSDPHEAAGAEGQVGDRAHRELALDRPTRPAREGPCRRQRLVDARRRRLDGSGRR
jgi:hypothetical protein